MRLVGLLVVAYLLLAGTAARYINWNGIGSMTYDGMTGANDAVKQHVEKAAKNKEVPLP